MFRFRCPTFKSRKAAKWEATFSVTEPPTPIRLENILSLNSKYIWKSNDSTFANEVINILSPKFESIWKSNDNPWQRGCKQSLPKLSLKISWKPIQINNQVCENLSNGSFSEEQKQVQKITANVDMYSDLMKQVFRKYLNTSTLSIWVPGSPHGLCPVPRTMERQGWKKTPHRFSILWQLPHLPWFLGQRLLFRPALCGVSVDRRGGH